MTGESPEKKLLHAKSEEISRKSFKQEVIINGLNFIFEGGIPKEPADFEWTISVPNWDEQKTRADEILRKAEESASFGSINPRYVRELPGLNLGEGKVGVLKVKQVAPTDKAKSIGIDRIQVETFYLPEEFRYNGAKGIGSFLLDRLCTLADANNWRIYLEPLERGGGLPQHQLYNWYLRRGFKNEGEFPKESRHNFGGMIRKPGENTTRLNFRKFVRRRSLY